MATLQESERTQENAGLEESAPRQPSRDTELSCSSLE